jgi:hypothetical protein
MGKVARRSTASSRAGSGLIVMGAGESGQSHWRATLMITFVFRFRFERELLPLSRHLDERCLYCSAALRGL